MAIHIVENPANIFTKVEFAESNQNDYQSHTTPVAYLLDGILTMPLTLARAIFVPPVTVAANTPQAFNKAYQVLFNKANEIADQSGYCYFSLDVVVEENTSEPFERPLGNSALSAVNLQPPKPKAPVLYSALNVYE